MNNSPHLTLPSKAHVKQPSNHINRLDPKEHHGGMKRVPRPKLEPDLHRTEMKDARPPRPSAIQLPKLNKDGHMKNSMRQSTHRTYGAWLVSTMGDALTPYSPSGT